MKRKLVLFSLVLILFITSAFIGAFLTDTKNKQSNFEIGKVDVDLNVYFEKNSVIKDTNILAPIASVNNEVMYKKGVYLVNITNTADIQFFENFRVNFMVKSNVDTYFRIKFFESKILKNVGTNGVITEYVLINDLKFNISSDFYKSKDGYYYYKNKVKHINETTALSVPFISNYFPGEVFGTAPIGQEVQVSFKIEAVQAYLGPQNNWGLQTKPWEGGGAW